MKDAQLVGWVEIRDATAGFRSYTLFTITLYRA